VQGRAPPAGGRRASTDDRVPRAARWHDVL